MARTSRGNSKKTTFLVPVTRRCEYRHIVPPGEFRCKHRHPVVLEKDYKIAYFDIEASGLQANFAIIYCWSLKYQGQSKVVSSCIHERSLEGEKKVLQDLLDELAKHENLALITYYGTNFDLPFVRTRCLYHGLDFPTYGTIKHIDLYYVARSRLSLHSKRLQVVAEFLGIEGKTPLRGDIWAMASLGDKTSLAYILQHNVQDVKVLEKVHALLEPFMKPTRRSI